MTGKRMRLGILKMGFITFTIILLFSSVLFPLMFNNKSSERPSILPVELEVSVGNETITVAWDFLSPSNYAYDSRLFLSDSCVQLNGAFRDIADLPGVDEAYCIYQTTDGYLYTSTGNTNGDVFRSIDGGTSWANTGDLSGVSIAYGGIVESDNGTIFVRTFVNMFKSENNGTSWENTGNNYVYGKIIKLSNGSLVVVGELYNTVYGSNDHGASWSAIGSIGSQSGITAICQLQNGSLLVGTQNSAQVHISDDGGVNWNLVTSIPGATYIRTILETQNGTLLCGTFSNAKVYRSVDGGTTWMDASQGLAGSYDFRNSVETPSQDIIVTDGSGILISTDNGQTWNKFSDISGSSSGFGNLIIAQNGSFYLAETDSNDVYIGGYDTSAPIITSVNPFEVENLSSWTSFSEEGKFYGQSIEYQISDDGSNWYYWSGLSWETTSTSWSSANVINDNINSFPNATGQLYFKAKLLSDGSSTPKLDKIKVGYYNGTTQDTTPPVLTEGGTDIGYELGDPGPFWATWTWTDLDPDTYNITQVGVGMVDSSTWASGVAITWDVTGLPVGTHTFRCDVEDGSTNPASDNVIVTVSDTISPILSADGNDLNYAVGAPGPIWANWTWTDLDADTYNITQVGVGMVDIGTWASGVPITWDVTGLSEGIHIFACSVQDGSGNTESDNITVTVTDEPIIIPPPFDFNYEFGAAGPFWISWTWTDSDPDSYNITQAGVGIVDSGTWVSGAPIIWNVTGLGLGVHTFTCSVNNTAGNTASDNVLVTVTDTTPPVLTAGGTDMGYELGDPGPYSATWTWSDLDPDTYNITQAGVGIVDSGTWTSGVPITWDVTGLSEGIHTFMCSVQDGSGNTANDNITVTVTPEEDNTAPSFTNVTESADPLEFGPYAETIMIHGVWDLSGINQVVMEFEGTNNTMTDMGNTTWYITWAPWSLGIYPYTIYIEDNNNNWNSTIGAILIQDTTAPTWFNLFESADPLPFGQNVTIAIDTFDFSGINLVLLEYEFTNHTMTDMGNTSIWSNWIPASAGNHTYFIYIEDNENNWNVTSGIITVEILAPAPPQIDDWIVTGDSITIIWTLSPDPAVDHYNIYRSPRRITDITGLTPIVSVGSNVSSYTDLGLINGNYYYVITAVNSLGQESVISNSIFVKINSQPPTFIIIIIIIFGSVAAAGTSSTVLILMRKITPEGDGKKKGISRLRADKYVQQAISYSRPPRLSMYQSTPYVLSGTGEDTLEIMEQITELPFSKEEKLELLMDLQGLPPAERASFLRAIHDRQPKNEVRTQLETLDEEIKTLIREERWVAASEKLVQAIKLAEFLGDQDFFNDLLVRFDEVQAAVHSLFGAWLERISRISEREFTILDHITDESSQGRVEPPSPCRICNIALPDDYEYVLCHECFAKFHRNCVLDWLERNRTCPVCLKRWSGWI